MTLPKKGKFNFFKKGNEKEGRQTGIRQTGLRNNPKLQIHTK